MDGKLYFCKPNSMSSVLEMRYLFQALLASFLLLVSCSQQYSVDGMSSQSILDGRMAYLRTLEDDDTHRTLDSCEVLHGQFHMSGPLDSVMCVRLFMGDDNFIPIVLEQGNVKVSIRNASVKIEGTPLNDRLYVFLTSRDSLAMLRAELPKKESEMYLEGYDQDQVLDVLVADEMQLNKALDKLETAFITDNFDNVLGITWFLHLCKQAQRRYGFPTTTPQIDEIYSRSPDSFRRNREISDYMRLCEGM